MIGTDLKLYTLNLIALTASFSKIEPLLKVVLLVLSIIYTAVRIYSHFSDKQENKKD